MLKNCGRGKLFPHGLTDGLAQLVGTRGAFEAATDAFQTLEHFINFHAIYQSANALRVAVAAAVELHVFQNAVLDFKLNRLTASALGSIGVSHI
jgi:hypothetical protein